MLKSIQLFFKQYLELLFRAEARYRFVNWISFFRIMAFPFLMIFVYNDQWNLFKWLIAISFFTDGLDGFLARKLKATSHLGAKLDSIGDDMIILAGLIAMIAHFPDFIMRELSLIMLMLGLFFLEMSIALYKYGKPSSLHTYLAKIAAVFQGIFFILCFFMDRPLDWLFYATAAITTLELIEEIIIVFLLPKWETNVKGLIWVLNMRNKT